MRLAIAEAKKCGEDVPVGSLLVAPNGKIVATGKNVKERSSDPTGHAEIVVIREASRDRGTWRLGDLTLFVTLEPCAMCAQALVDARIKRVVFGAWDERAGAAGSRLDLIRGNSTGTLVEVVGGVLEKACSQLLVDFFSKRRKDF